MGGVRGSVIRMGWGNPRIFVGNAMRVCLFPTNPWVRFVIIFFGGSFPLSAGGLGGGGFELGMCLVRVMGKAEFFEESCEWVLGGSAET